MASKQYGVSSEEKHRVDSAEAKTHTAESLENFNEDGSNPDISEDLAKDQINLAQHANSVAKLLSNDYLVKQRAKQVRAANAQRKRRRSTMDKMSKRNDKIQHLFATFDIDGDGTIDEVEFAELVSYLRIPISRDRMSSEFTNIDKDSSGSICLEEFTNWYNGNGKTLIKSQGWGRFQLNLRAVSAAGKKEREMKLAKYMIMRENFIREREAQEIAQQEAADRQERRRSIMEEDMRAAAADLEQTLSDEIKSMDGSPNDDSEVNINTDVQEQEQQQVHQQEQQQVHQQEQQQVHQQEQQQVHQQEQQQVQLSTIAHQIAPWNRSVGSDIFDSDVEEILSSSFDASEFTCIALKLVELRNRNYPLSSSGTRTDKADADAGADAGLSVDVGMNADADAGVDVSARARAKMSFRMQIVMKTAQWDETSSMLALAQYCVSETSSAEPLFVLFKASDGFTDGVFDKLADDTQIIDGVPQTLDGGVVQQAGHGGFSRWHLVCHIPVTLRAVELAEFMRAYNYLVEDTRIKRFLPSQTAGVPPFIRDFTTLAGESGFRSVNSKALCELRIGMALRTEAYAAGGTEIIGRESELLQLHTLTHTQSSSSTILDGKMRANGAVVLSGKIGTGKKTLAAAYARLASQHFPMGVFTLHIGDEFQLDTSVRIAIQKIASLFPSYQKYASRTNSASYTMADDEGINTSIDADVDTIKISVMETIFLNHLHASAGWLLILPSVASCSDLYTYLKSRKLLQRCGFYGGSDNKTFGSNSLFGGGTIIVTADMNKKKFLAEPSKSILLNQAAGFQILDVDVFSRHEGTTYLLSHLFTLNAPFCTDDDQTNHDNLDSSKTIDETNKTLCKIVHDAKIITKALHRNPCALRLSISAIKYILEGQLRRRDKQFFETEGQEVVIQLNDSNNEHSWPTSDAAIAASLKEYVKYLMNSSKTLVSSKNEKVPGTSQTVTLALMTNIAILRSNSGQDWKKISLLLQLCTAIEGRSIPLALISRLLKAANASKGKETQRMNAKIEEKVLNICVMIEQLGFVSIRNTPALSLLLDRHPSFGSAASALSIDISMVYFNNSIHLALRDVINSKLKLLPVIAGLLDKGYKKSVGEEIVADNAHDRLGLGNESCISAAYFSPSNYKQAPPATRHILAAVYMMHLYTLLTRQKPPKIQIKRSLDDFLGYFYRIAAFARECSCLDIAATFFGKVIKWQNATSSTPKVSIQIILQRRLLAISAMRHMVSLWVSERKYDQALKQCHRMKEILTKSLVNKDTQRKKLQQVTALLEGDIQWRLHALEKCFVVYDTLIKKFAKKEGDNIRSLSNMIMARLHYRIGYIRLNRVFIRGQLQLLSHNDEDLNNRLEVEQAAEFFQRSLALQQAVYGGSVSRYETGLALHGLGIALQLLLSAPLKSLGIMEQALAMFQRLLATTTTKSPDRQYMIIDDSIMNAIQAVNQSGSRISETDESDGKNSSLQCVPPGPTEDWTVAELLVTIGHLYFDIGMHLLYAKKTTNVGSTVGTGHEIRDTDPMRQSKNTTFRHDKAKKNAPNMVVSREADALPYFRRSLEHFLLIKDDLHVATECARAVQKIHDRLKQCYASYFMKSGPLAAKAAGLDVESALVTRDSRQLTGPALLREILRLRPLLHPEALASSVNKMQVQTTSMGRYRDHEKVSDASVTPEKDGLLGDCTVIACEVDDFRMQWIKSHLQKMAYLRFSDLSSLIRKVRVEQKRKNRKESNNRNNDKSQKKKIQSKRHFNGITLVEFKDIIRKDLQVPKRMITTDEIEKMFAYMSQGGEGIEHTELVRFLIDEELLKKIHFKLQAATYKLGGRDFESEVFKRQDGDKSGLLDFGEFVSLFRKVLKLSPKTCSDLDVRTVFEYMGGNYEEGVHQDRFKEFLDEDFNLDYATRRLKPTLRTAASSIEFNSKKNNKVENIHSKNKHHHKTASEVPAQLSDEKLDNHYNSNGVHSLKVKPSAEASVDLVSITHKANVNASPKSNKTRANELGKRNNIAVYVKEFFQEKHPEKLKEVPLVLKKFEGKEKKLIRTLTKLYGNEVSLYFKGKGFGL